LIVGRVLQGQKAFQEGVNPRGPWATMSTTAWLGTIAGLVAQERCAQLVEPRAAYPKVAGCSDGIEAPGIKVDEDTTDELGWQPMNQLFLFTPLTCLGSLVSRQSFLRHPWRLCLQTSGVFRMWPRGLMAVGFGPRASIAPTRDPEARAPLAKPTAPVALQQSRILRATLDACLQSAGHQSIAAARRRNPVLFRLPVRFCSVSVRFCSGPDRDELGGCVPSASRYETPR
jgi:hypothetical protein